MGVELDKRGYTDLYALDISQEMLNEAKKKNLYKNFICAPLSDQRIPEIDTGEFDVLTCVGVLVKGHVRSSAFGEMVRMVKSGEISVLQCCANFILWFVKNDAFLEYIIGALSIFLSVSEPKPYAWVAVGSWLVPFRTHKHDMLVWQVSTL